MTRPAATPVAIVRTRPETVRDDVRRGLSMAGFAPVPEATAVLGEGAAPWHLAAGLAAARGDASAAPASRLSSDIRCALLLTRVGLDSALGLDGCLAALARLGGGARGRREDPVAHTLASGSSWLADGPEFAFLVDATLVPGRPRPGAPLRARNLLLAGRDPVALDAVAARLCGVAPLSVPLLARAEADGLGRIHPAPADLLGDGDALEGRPAVAWRPGGDGPLARLIGRLRGRSDRPATAQGGDSPWFALRRSQADPVDPEASRHV